MPPICYIYHMTVSKCRAKNPSLCPYHSNPFERRNYQLSAEARKNRSDVHSYSNPVVAERFGWSEERVQEAKNNVPAYDLREEWGNDKTLGGAQAALNESARQYNASRNIFLKNYENIDLPVGSFENFMDSQAWEYSRVISPEMLAAKEDLDAKKRKYETARENYQKLSAYKKLKDKTAETLKMSIGDENDTLFKKLKPKRIQEIIEQQEWSLTHAVEHYESLTKKPGLSQDEYDNYAKLAVATRAVLIDLRGYKLTVNQASELNLL